MKVLYLLNFAGKAGTERYVESLVKYLRPMGVEPYFAYNISGLLVERMEEMGVPCFQLSMDSRFDLKAAKKLAAICRENGIELIHTHYLRENYIAMLSKRWNPGVKVLYTNHFVLHNNTITKISNRLLSRRQDAVIAVCNLGKQVMIQNKMDGSKIHVIFNAVDPADWAEPVESTLRAELNIPAETVVLFCASRFAHDKGHSYLIESVKALQGMTDKAFRLVLAGDGDLLEQTKAQVRELGLEDLVDFVGFRKDIKNLYYGSDIYVNASEHEALSFLIVEAMASGLPVIATNMAGNPDIVGPDARCGIQVEYNNPDSMAAAMKKLIEDPDLRSSCSAGALQDVEEKFNIHKMAAATFEVYKGAVKR